MCTVENESEKWLRNFLGFLTFFVSLFGLKVESTKIDRSSWYY